MRFDSSLRDLWREEGGAWRGEMPSGWMQGRSVFGGLTAAMCTGLARRVVGDERALRTVSVHLVSPTKPGAMDGACRVVRKGKNVTFVEVRLSQEGEERALMTAVFAAPREGGVVIEPIAPAEEVNVESLEDLPYLEGLTPEFTQHLQLRWARGQFPYTGGSKAMTRGYCRFREQAGDEEGVLGMLDAWPAPSLSLLDGPAPASTVSWTAHLLATPAHDGWFAFAYDTVVGENGFHTVCGQLRDPRGKLVGWTEQLVVVFG